MSDRLIVFVVFVVCFAPTLALAVWFEVEHQKQRRADKRLAARVAAIANRR